MPNLRLGANPHAIASTLIWGIHYACYGKALQDYSFVEVSLSCMVASSNMGHQVLFDLQIKCAGDIT